MSFYIGRSNWRKKKGKLDKRDLNENNFQWRDFIFIGNF